MLMETSQPLATESFSYSWLINRKSSFHGLDEPFRPSLDYSNEATPKETKSLLKSKRFLEEGQNFNFDVPISKSSVPLVHADEIFSDGHIKPIYVTRSKIEAFNTSTSVPATPISSLSSRTICPADRSRYRFLRKWRKSSKIILQQCIGFLRPLCPRVGCTRKSIRVDAIDRKVLEIKRSSNSLQASPGRSTACSMGDWSESDIKQISNKIDAYRRLRKVQSLASSPQESPPQTPSYSNNVLCDTESSIYEAVLHCKRSSER